MATPRTGVKFTYLEAMAACFTGIAPWLESGPLTGPEGGLRSQYAEWSRMGYCGWY